MARRGGQQGAKYNGRAAGGVAGTRRGVDGLRTASLKSRMLRYLLQRTLGLLPTLLVIVSLSFLILRLAPGGPFDQEQGLPPEVRANLERAYGLEPEPAGAVRALPARAGARGPRPLAAPARLHRERADRAGAAGEPDARASQRCCWRWPAASPPASPRRCGAARRSTTRSPARPRSPWRCRASSSGRCWRWCSRSTCTGCRWPAGSPAPRASWCCR